MKLHLALDTFLLTIAVSAALLIIWLSSGATRLLEDQSGSVVSSLVLRADVTAESAEDVLKSVREVSAQSDQIRTTLLTPADARAQLSLQEDWMANLPDVELQRLPVVIQVQHLDLTSNAEGVARRNEAYKQLREVEFVAFSDIEMDAVLNASERVRSVVSTARNLLLVAVVAMLTIYGIRSITLMDSGSGRTMRLRAATAIAGVGLGTLLFGAAVSMAGRAYNLSSLSLMQWLLTSAALCAVWFVTALFPRVTKGR